MENYILKKDEEKAGSATFNKDLDGYNFKSNHSNSLNVDEVLIAKPELVDKILTNNIKEKYKRLVMIVLSIMRASDTSEGDCILALDEIARLKDILLHRYNKNIKREKQELFLDQLCQLESQLHQKINQIRAINMMFSIGEEEKHMGR